MSCEGSPTNKFDATFWGVTGSAYFEGEESICYSEAKAGGWNEVLPIINELGGLL